MKVLPNSSFWRAIGIGVLACLGACGGGPERAPYARDLDEASLPVTATSAERVPGAECSDGAIEQCVVPLPAHGSVKSCFQGFRKCTAGAFGPCVAAEDLELEP